jgi:hypothetical protein
LYRRVRGSNFYTVRVIFELRIHRRDAEGTENLELFLV